MSEVLIVLGSSLKKPGAESDQRAPAEASRSSLALGCGRGRHPVVSFPRPWSLGSSVAPHAGQNGCHQKTPPRDKC